MARPLLSVAVALVAVSASACVSTPEAAELQRHAAQGPTLSAAEATEALQSYVEMVNEGLRGEGVEDLAEVTDPQCSCSGLVGMIRRGTAGGGEFVDATFTAEDLEVRSAEGSTAVVRARISVSAYQVRNPDGVLVDREPATSYRADYTLRTDGEQWRVVEVAPAG